MSEHVQQILYRMIRDLAPDHSGSLQRKNHHEGIRTIEALENIAAGEPAASKLRTAIMALSRRQQQILVLHKLRGWSQAAIAVQLGISVGAVEKDLRRALRVCLDAEARDT